MDSSNEARHSAAHYFLEGLNEIGFDYLFCNFGTDHAPLIEAMAAFKRADHPAPPGLRPTSSSQRSSNSLRKLVRDPRFRRLYVGGFLSSLVLLVD